jgi:hypothetical protein
LTRIRERKLQFNEVKGSQNLERRKMNKEDECEAMTEIEGLLLVLFLEFSTSVAQFHLIFTCMRSEAKRRLNS